jgi:hypothetical protein
VFCTRKKSRFCLTSDPLQLKSRNGSAYEIKANIYINETLVFDLDMEFTVVLKYKQLAALYAILFSPITCCMPIPFRPLRFEHFNNIWCNMLVSKFPIMLFFPAPLPHPSDA